MHLMCLTQSTRLWLSRWALQQGLYCRVQRLALGGAGVAEAVQVHDRTVQWLVRTAIQGRNGKHNNVSAACVCCVCVCAPASSTLQVSEANQQRKRQREHTDKDALALGLRARPLVCDVSLMQQQQVVQQQQQAQPADPRRRAQGSPPAAGEAARAQQHKPAVGADGVLRLPPPRFARSKLYLGPEINASLELRMHEAATKAARDRVLAQRAQLLQEARQGAGSGGQQAHQQHRVALQQPQQQQQAEEGEVGEVEQPLSEAALDLERLDAQWELVVLLAKSNAPQAGVRWAQVPACLPAASLAQHWVVRQQG